jgi:acyl-CoA dehydrogenase
VTDICHLPFFRLPREAEVIRSAVRAFVAEQRQCGALGPPSEIGMRSDAAMTRQLASRGWIGMTWPTRYGGAAQSVLSRYVVTEELVAAGVPVGSHWVADRQSGPLILRYGTEQQKQRYLPPICAGESFFCIGMSEPDSGSDLASLRTTAKKVPGGWELSGQKIWTSRAHQAHFMIALVRTAPSEGRHDGLSQFIVDLAAPGITIRPIVNMVGQHDFNEVFMDAVFVPDDALIGTAGSGWSQVGAELAYERSGPERWLSAFVLLSELIRELAGVADAATSREVGRIGAQLLTLRQMSISVAGSIDRGDTPAVEAAIIKDLGTRFEQDMIRTVRDIAARELERGGSPAFRRLLHNALLWAPAFTIRGGTGEIMRGIIARGLGAR